MNAEASWRRGMVRIDVDGAAALVTFDRPDKLNAMDRAFWPDLRAALSWVEAQPDLRCVVFRGAGTRAFSVGGDVASFAALGTAEMRREFQVDAMATFEAVAASPMPTIAAVHGYALGGGCEMAMACDIAIAADDAVFGLPEARFGLVPGYGVLRAPSIVGAQMAKLMIFAGERLTAAEALRHGLVQKLFPAEALIPEALKLAASIASAPRSAIGAGKSLIRATLDPALIQLSIETVTALHSTPESRNAVSAFSGGDE
jgi:enoyl-CoA hydratase